MAVESVPVIPGVEPALAGLTGLQADALSFEDRGDRSFGAKLLGRSGRSASGGAGQTCEEKAKHRGGYHDM
jgi:hypothetical protein